MDFIKGCRNRSSRGGDKKCQEGQKTVHYNNDDFVENDNDEDNDDDDDGNDNDDDNDNDE